MSSEIQSINNFLLQKQIKVESDWIEACVDWLRSEGRSTNLERQVYQQWLTTDLRELGCGCLPQGVTEEKYTLNGKFCLQINSLIDTSKSYYSQLQQVKGSNDNNVEVTAETQQTQYSQRWQKNNARMLMIELTDGVNNLFGLEYKHINCLTTGTPPGTKVRIRGPVLCRKGVMMLENGNVEMLGGGESTHGDKNYEKTLCRALGLPVADDEGESDGRNSGENGNEGENSLARNGNYGESSAQNQNAFPEDDFEDDIDADILSQIVDDQDFDEEDSVVPQKKQCYEEDVFENMQSFPSAERSNIQSIFPTRNRQDFPPAVRNSTHSVFSTSSMSAGLPTSSTNARSRQDRNRTHVEQNNFPSTSTHANTQNNFSTNNQHGNQRQNFPTTSTQRGNRQSNINNFFTKKTSSTPDDDDDFISPTPVVKSSYFASNTQISTQSQNSRKIVPTFKPAVKKSVKKEPEVVDLTQMDFDDHDFTDNLFEDKFMDDDFFLEDQLQNDQPEEPKPKSSFTYFCSVKKTPTPQTFLSKSFLITLLSKLSQNSSTEWQLKVRLGDGTGFLDAKFSNKVLEKIIGFSCKRIQQVREDGDERGMARIREGMQECQRNLYGMMKIFKVEYDPGEELANVVDIVECQNSKFPHV